MREIRFRAWDIVTGTWFVPVYEAYKGNLRDISISLSGQVIERTMEEPASIIQSGRWILQQFTGILDKNGKDIFEGDIVLIENGEDNVTTVCKWDNGCFTLEDLATGTWTRQLFHQSHRLIIAGNIFENPELL